MKLNSRWSLFPDVVMAAMIWGTGIWFWLIFLHPGTYPQVLAMPLSLFTNPIGTGIWLQIRHSRRMLVLTDKHRREELALTELSATDYLKSGMTAQLRTSFLINYSYLAIHWAFWIWVYIYESKPTGAKEVLEAIGFFLLLISLEACAAGLSLIGLLEVSIRECQKPRSGWRILAPVLTSLTLVLAPAGFTLGWALVLFDLDEWILLLPVLIGLGLWVFVWVLAQKRIKKLYEIYFNFE